MLVLDDTINKTGFSEKELLINFSCWMFDKSFLTISQAAKFCGLNYAEMMKELANRKISIIDEASILLELEEINKNN